MTSKTKFLYDYSVLRHPTVVSNHGGHALRHRVNQSLHVRSIHVQQHIAHTGDEGSAGFEPVRRAEAEAPVGFAEHVLNDMAILELRRPVPLHAPSGPKSGPADVVRRQGSGACGGGENGIVIEKHQPDTASRPVRVALPERGDQNRNERNELNAVPAALKMLGEWALVSSPAKPCEEFDTTTPGRVGFGVAGAIRVQTLVLLTIHAPSLCIDPLYWVLCVLESFHIDTHVTARNPVGYEEAEDGVREDAARHAHVHGEEALRQPREGLVAQLLDLRGHRAARARQLQRGLGSLFDYSISPNSLQSNPLKFGTNLWVHIAANGAGVPAIETNTQRSKQKIKLAEAAGIGGTPRRAKSKESEAASAGEESVRTKMKTNKQTNKETKNVEQCVRAFARAAVVPPVARVLRMWRFRRLRMLFPSLFVCSLLQS